MLCVLAMLALVFTVSCATQDIKSSPPVANNPSPEKTKASQPPVTIRTSLQQSSQKPIKVMIMGRIKNDFIDFKGCPQVFVVTIENKNGDKSYKSKRIKVIDNAVYKILGKKIISGDEKIIEGFQALIDKNGYYYLTLRS